MATNSVNAIDAILRATSPRLIVTAVTIGATGGSFLKAKNTATLSPANITLTTTITGLTLPTYQWYYATSSAPTTWVSIAGATSSSYVVTNTNYSTHKGSGTQVVYKCIATQTGWASTESSIIITYSQQSNDVPVATLSKTSISLPTTAADVVDYSTSACDIVVSIGGTNIPYAASGNNTYSVSTSATNITVGAATTTTTTVTNDTRSFGVMSGMAAGQVTGTITYTVTARDVDGVATTIKLVQTITKATAGGSSTEVSMSSSAVTLNADAAGVVTVFTNSGNTFTVTNGGVAYLFKNTGTAAGTFKITTVQSNVTAGSWTGYDTATATLSNITAFTANTSGTLTFTILVYLTAGVATTFTRTQTFTQAKESVAETAVFAYYVINNTALPTAPTIVQNTVPTSGPVVLNNQWYLQPKASLATNDWQFQISGTKSAAGVYTWESSLTGYLSTFKVGKLSALSAQMGIVEIDTSGALYSTGASYLGTTPGYYMGYTGGAHKFSIGDGTNYLGWNGSSLEFQGYTLYGKYSLGTSNILAVTRVLPTVTPIVYFRDNQNLSITATNSTTDVITLSAGYSTKHFNTAPNTAIKFNFTSGGIVSGTTYYVKTVIDYKNFTISSTPGGTIFNITSNLSNPGNATFVVSLTTKLMEINGNNTGAAVDVINTNDAGGALGAYGYSGGIMASQVVLGWGATAINLVQGGIKFNDSFVTDTRTLDDYKEGTWTPVAAPAVGTFTYVTNGQIGKYTKIGNKVFFTCRVGINAVSVACSGGLNITGLPYTSNSSTFTFTAVSIWGQTLPGSWSGNAGGSAWGVPQAVIVNNSSAIRVSRLYAGTDIDDMGYSIVTGAIYTISGSYLV